MPTGDEDAAQQEKWPSRLVFDQRTGRLVIDGLAEVEEPSNAEEEQAESKAGAKEEAPEVDEVDWGGDGEAEKAEDEGAKTQKTPEEVKGEDDKERDEDEADAKGEDNEEESQEEDKEEEEETEDDGARTQQKPEEVEEEEDDKETDEDEPDAKQEADASGARPGSEEEQSPRSRSNSLAADHFDGFRATAAEEWHNRFGKEGSAKGGAQKEESQEAAACQAKGKHTNAQNTKEQRKGVARIMKEKLRRGSNEKELVALQMEVSRVRNERSNTALQLAALEESPDSQVSY
jgi:hypothetical protein